MTPVIVIAAIAVLIAAGAFAVARSARARDGVDSFRRQIDALSPEARRPTIDQVHRAGQATEDEGDEADGGEADGDDEGGRRGT